MHCRELAAGKRQDGTITESERVQAAARDGSDHASVSSTPMNPLCSPPDKTASSSRYAAPAADRMPASRRSQHQAASQIVSDATPAPVQDETPQGWPDGPLQSNREADAEALLQPVSLFDELGPHPMQSLAQRPLQPAASAAAQPHVRASLTTRHASAGSQSRSVSGNSISGSSDGSYHGSSAGRAAAEWSISPRAQQGSAEGFKTAEEGGAGAGREWVGGAGGNAGGQVEAHRRSLLPPVLPKYRTSPLCTPHISALHASHAAPRAALHSWRRSADAAASHLGPAISNVAPLAFSPAHAELAAAPESSDAAAGNSLQEGSLEHRLQVSSGLHLSTGAAAVAAGRRAERAAASGTRVAQSTSEMRSWHREEVQAVRRSVPLIQHRYSNAGSPGTVEDEALRNADESGPRGLRHFSMPLRPSMQQQHLAQGTPSLASSTTSDEVQLLLAHGMHICIRFRSISCIA